jgi:hypothetical protein
MPTIGSSLVGTFDRSVEALTVVPMEQRRAFLQFPPTRQAHAEAHAMVPAFREVERNGRTEHAPPATGKLRVGAWNLERCLYPDMAARILRQHEVGLALLTEMDHGALRTGQTHTIAQVAGELGQQYAFGLEFLELGPMPPPPGFPTVGEHNQFGFHGNGIVTALPIESPMVIRLDEAADWCISPKGGQRRIGNRMAVAGTVTWGGLRFLACSVHLESATDGTGRATQMRSLLDAIDQYAEPGLPVLIGGDLNSHVQPGGYDDPSEPLFSIAMKRGYDFAACNRAGATTRDSVWTKSEGTCQLDWFCTRGLSAAEPEIIGSVGPDGTVLTDHELILLTISA